MLPTCGPIYRLRETLSLDQCVRIFSTLVIAFSRTQTHKIHTHIIMYTDIHQTHGKGTTIVLVSYQSYYTFFFRPSGVIYHTTTSANLYRKLRHRQHSAFVCSRHCLQVHNLTYIECIFQRIFVQEKNRQHINLYCYKQISTARTQPINRKTNI